MWSLRGFIALWTACVVFAGTSADSEPPSHASRLRYKTDQFNEQIPLNSHFVMFYAPWCGHCQKLAPIWAQLEELLNVEGSRVTIASVDCTKEKDLCAEHDITGYPTLKFFKIGVSEGVKFRGIRDLPNLSSFINEQLGESSVEEHLRVPIVVNIGKELTEDTFHDHVAKGYHFVKFYAPWCGHCQRLAPTWEKLAETFVDSGAVSIGKVDCTLYRDICTEFDVKGYPTLLWIEDGKRIEKYSGQRSHADFKAFINKMVSVPNEEIKDADPDVMDGNAVMTLTTNNFENGVQSGFVFVKFFAPWCGHCKRLAPTWDELGRKFINDNLVKVAKVDCSIQINKSLCSMENVDGFPSLLLFKDGVKIAEYDGSRSLDDLHEFVTNKVNSAHDEL
ncbi:thioredoxin domain-containing protein pretaporter [Arctopsyche grandis]|uniref:thioredoxin domain-containing protein pretaporter n=1 Tax=Arctopsyche grandis TaxID=121162 RepID=UPI00406D95F9